ncbi:MAG TPA: hypothetical protein VJ550_04085 [Geomonas sp.]|nr:hypothetical protein [Geomonas sp.]
MGNDVSIKWLPEPEEQDYPAAFSYLCLTYDVSEADQIVARLRRAEMTKFKAKDIFRASCLPLLGISNSHLQKDQKKIKSGKELSPLLLVRDRANRKLVVADGYHRMCAVYSFDEDAWIPCKIA